MNGAVGLTGPLVEVMYAFGVNACGPELITNPCVDDVDPETSIDDVAGNPDDVCIIAFCPVGKNMPAEDGNPIVGIGGSGNTIGGFSAGIVDTIIGAELDVEAGADTVEPAALIDTWL